MGESVMQFSLLPRLGIGFDIEHNDTIIHIIDNEDGKGKILAAYEGIIIKLPFLSIYYGEFAKFDKRVLD
jgi:hypothetical protein